MSICPFHVFLMILITYPRFSIFDKTDRKDSGTRLYQTFRFCEMLIFQKRPYLLNEFLIFVNYVNSLDPS